MINPGSNLLKKAFKLIAKQEAQHLRFKGRKTNGAGYDVSEYYPQETIRGSFQPVPRSRYEAYGLDFSKSYATFYSTTDIGCLERGESGDILLFAGRRWQCQAPNDWFQIDGWTGVLIVDIGAEKDCDCE